MADDGALKIIIRHVSGAKANQIEEFDLGGRDEIRIGRASSNNIVYDSPRDDVVSRAHAVISVVNRQPLAFMLKDLNSRNGTFLDGEKLIGSSELLPDDKVSFGPNGPSFIFDVQPRPETLRARTRVIDVSGMGETRIISAAEARTAAVPAAMDQSAALTHGAAASLSRDLVTAPQKQGVGERTMMAAIVKERSSANRLWLSVAGGLGALVALAGAGLYWKTLSDEQSHQESLAQIESVVREESRRIDAKVAGEDLQRGMSPQNIVEQYGPATAKVRVDWRLFDQKTGLPIFQKTVTEKGTNRRYRLYVKLGDGSIVRYLTLDDGGRANLPIRGHIEGTAFVVNEQGFLLTNKHLAAAWRLPFEDCECTEKEGLLIQQTGKRKKPLSYSLIDLNNEEYDSVRKWTPESGGIVFAGSDLRVVGPYNLPDPSKNEKHNFMGRNELIEVVFPEASNGITARLVTSSPDSDAALIKVDTPHALRKVEIASEDNRVTPGEHIVVLGYPDVAAPVFALSETIENGTYRTSTDRIPQPYVTDGIVALVSTNISIRNEATSNVKYFGGSGDVIQLTVNSTGRGNSGGPVFDSSGKVIGLFTYLGPGGVNSDAVPIKYGRALLNAQ